MPRSRVLFRVAALASLLLVLLAYSNHFRNSFHFDDSHTVIDNPWIRDLSNVPRFFTDGQTFSSLPSNRSYRPLVSASLAFDYWLAHGLNPLWFHISTFFWYLLQLALMFLLFRNIFDRARPDPVNPWIALIATAIYAVHPVMAETVNYIIQRGDIYATLGVVAGLTLFALQPGLRRYGLYLLPVIAGILSKPPAAVFPVLLFLFVWLFEEERLKSAVVKSVPSFLVVGAAALFTAKMNPPSFVAGASSAWAYRLSQPAVLLTYFRKFFLPLGLSADTDRIPYQSLLETDAAAGVLFIAILAALAWWALKRREYRPIAFGIAWFLIASLPTSLIALAEVENDHRMYFPFVGLTMAVAWAVALYLSRRRVSPQLTAAVCALVLAGFAWGTRERNIVWSTDETLWRDVTLKSPNNGRGWMNYGLTRMEKADFPGALAAFQKASLLTPNYYFLEINLGIAYGASGRPAEAEAHFLRAIQLAPAETAPRYYFARWLSETRRNPEAIAQLTVAVGLNPDYIAARYLLLQLYSIQGDTAKLDALAQDTIARFPSDNTARSFLGPSPQRYLNQSLALYSAGKYDECIAAAREALKLQPNYAEAWNNIAAAYNSMSKWDQGIAAADEAIRLNPAFQLAKNNRAWALSQKQK